MVFSNLQFDRVNLFSKITFRTENFIFTKRILLASLPNNDAISDIRRSSSSSFKPFFLFFLLRGIWQKKVKEWYYHHLPKTKRNQIGIDCLSNLYIQFFNQYTNEQQIVKPLIHWCIKCNFHNATFKPRSKARKECEECTFNMLLHLIPTMKEGEQNLPYP